MVTKLSRSDITHEWWKESDEEFYENGSISVPNKTNDMVTKLELLDEIYNDIMNDYVPTTEVTEALEAVRELAKKLENL